MHTDRREFLRVATAAGGAFALGVARPDLLAGATRASGAPLRILILGGTGFIGPHQVRYALDRGHTVTLFNRGRRNPQLFPDVEKLVGDRDSDLSALEGRRWDVVIDNSGYVPRHVRDSAELLKDRCGRYLYISTVAVYDFDSGSVFPEDAKLAELRDPTVEEVTGETYGPLKAACDVAVREIVGGYGADLAIDCSGHPSAGPEGIEMLRDGGTYVEMGQFTDAGPISTNWHRICTKDLNVLGSWAFTANDLPLGVAMLDRARERYPWFDMQTLFPFTEAGLSEAIAAAMAMRTVKSTIVPFEGLD